ncbi:hypothetical protein ACQAYK_05490 [Acidithiobacillus sp. AC3]
MDWHLVTEIDISAVKIRKQRCLFPRFCLPTGDGCSILTSANFSENLMAKIRNPADKVAILFVAALVLIGGLALYFHEMHSAITDLRSGILAGAKQAESRIHSMAGTQTVPTSKSLRIVGKIQKGNQSDYVAAGLSGEYVVIPATDCRTESVGPVCAYHGVMVTRSSGERT